MYTLDLMTNAHFTPKPVEAKKGDVHDGEAGAIKMEETIPLMVSRATRSAPTEQKDSKRVPEKTREEMNTDEKKARRRAKKYMRKAAMKQRLETGNMTLEGKKERDSKLAEKNKKEKAEARAAKLGIDHKANRRTKIRSTDLLAKAAEATAADLSRKGAKRAQRAADRDATAKPSKRIKL